MKILFIIPFLSGGGAERVVSILASKMKRENIEADILTFYRVKNEYEISEDVKIYSLRDSLECYKQMSSFQKLIEIRKNIKKINPDFIIPFIEYVGIISNVARIGLPVKFIETVRNNPKEFPNNCIMRFFRNLSILFSDLCIVQNKGQIDYFSNRIKKKCKILNNPINDKFFENKKIFSDNSINKIILVGRLEKQKNQIMVLKSIKDIIKIKKDISLEIYGEGNLKNVLNDYILKNNLQKNVKIFNRTNNIIEKLLDSDLFILSSNQEGMPNSLMEAMALGIPCISTDCPYGPSDIIENEIDGILIDVGDIDSLTKNIEKSINNPKYFIELSKLGRKKMITKYNSEAITDKLLNYLIELE